MPKRKVTIPELLNMKREGKKIRMVTSYDYITALLVEETDIEMILVGDSLGMVVLGYEGTVPVTMEEMLHHIKPVVRAARNTFVVGDMPFGSYNESIESAIHNANRILKEGGADAVKLEGGLNVVKTVEALVSAGIPVMGHIGLTPQTATQLGGFKVQGKDIEAARRLLEEAQALEAAGAFSIVLECIPSPLARAITERVSIPTIGIGAGPYCDGQVLVIHDMLGMFKRFVPKFVKKYADLAPQILEALKRYASEVAEGVFPGPEHSFGMNEEILSQLAAGEGKRC
ncbi:MAG: 3-methyl-2-oxobutanoate hydroxymethyltransferase [Thermanaeromonas sp.]|uniref:3-methyl-2-oxobutanoate hydroxymethyltransferase n=1 Tax=Thermanaeromonas sp. TaxID=2003697 RepID=UPI00243D93B3|nr:3-methyl-2-oxobutanoate hydroxymethyltransferase [Thermanaeromonas sp.]MCG0276955.1 3-methyl-2-oxobutanoate hydroxymethyltransferase [Thermanaeromonas sp.]